MGRVTISNQPSAKATVGVTGCRVKSGRGKSSRPGTVSLRSLVSLPPAFSTTTARAGCCRWSTTNCAALRPSAWPTGTCVRHWARSGASKTGNFAFLRTMRIVAAAGSDDADREARPGAASARRTAHVLHADGESAYVEPGGAADGRRGPPPSTEAPKRRRQHAPEREMSLLSEKATFLERVSCSPSGASFPGGN
jgi:hypothetical protein